MERVKYNLTLLQWLQLPFFYLHWINTPKQIRKSWHMLLKGMEKHEHICSIQEYSKGYTYKVCEHEGCGYYDADSVKFQGTPKRSKWK